ncbi:MAG: DEAD/DEAH box helicase [Halobacteriovoraceae bacterium]|nr:DEAD/DEAH box helicase [Halobacteriovoraceae bacterium]
MSAFNKLNLSTELLEFLQENHFKQPTPVQEQSILAYFKGESVDAISSTGTGKTLAFLLPIFEVLKSDERLNGVNELKNSPGAVILCPTRELAKQIAQLAKVISHKCRLRVRSLLTGENISGSIYDILITVPGKLQAAIKNKHVEAKNIRHLILDESDQLVEFGFLSEITHIYRSIGECQVGMFSATTMDGRDEFKAKIFGDKIFTQIECQQANILRDNIDTFNIYLSQNQKLQFLKDLTKRNSKSRGIVFVNKSETVIELKELLAQDKLALPVHFLSGKMDKKERLKVVEEFKSVKSVLICTDIMARGIDIPSIVWALNYDLPFEAAYYVHRCGRVGRAKNSTGQVYNFVTQLDQSIISRINIAITGQNALKLDLIKGPKLQKTQKKSTSSNKALNSVKIKRPLQKFKKRPRFAKRK